MAGGGADNVPLREKLFWILAYSACSSSMLVINKLAVQSLPLPTVVSGAQLTVSAVVVVVLQCCGKNVMGPMDKTKVLPFALYTAMFAGGLFANMKALMLTNVGAVIAARSCLPVVVCAIEWAFMGRALPSMRSVVSLSGVVAFATMYIKFDSGVAVAGIEGFLWLALWWILLALQMTYGRWMTEKIEMTQWERVFYTNAFALPPTAVLFMATGEQAKVAGLEMGNSAWFWLAASCAMGVGISYTGWRSRSVTTATTFTLVGVLNKMATIAVTVAVWPHDTSVLSIMCLVCCILFGLLYQDAPKRNASRSGKTAFV
mmetsp:Transcript_12022/g.29172  ORF Transcript_12022/g.29172 Transcript_12022/m.29172 type:complete len:316 (-) Transcript_12022:288-1235(-)